MTIFCVFAAIRFAMPAIYTGSAIDEYYHLVGALPDFPDTGYTRGRYLTWLVGLVCGMFGRSLYVAKLVPIVLGLINFALLWRLADYLCRGRKSFVALVLLLYTVSPWSVFSHQYVRMYGFLEFMLMLNFLAFCRIESALERGALRAACGWWAMVAVMDAAFFALNGTLGVANSGDTSKWIPAVMLGLQTGPLLVFRDWSDLGGAGPLWRLLRLPARLRLLLVLLAVLLVTAALGLADRLLLQMTTDQSRIVRHYVTDTMIVPRFFLLHNVLLIIGVGLALARRTRFGHDASWVIGACVVFLIALHCTVHSHAYMMRSVIYLLPAFYAVACAGYARIPLPSPAVAILAAVITVGVVRGYPPTFFSIGPSIPHEIQYRDYATVYRDLKTLGPEARIFTAMTFPRRISMFYGLRPEREAAALGGRANEQEFMATIQAFLDAEPPVYLVLDQEAIARLNRNDQRHLLKRPDIGKRRYHPLIMVYWHEPSTEPQETVPTLQP